MMTPEERARKLVLDLGYQWTPHQVSIIAAAIRAAVNDATTAAYEKAAARIEALERGEIASPYSAAELVRAMKVK